MMSKMIKLKELRLCFNLIDFIPPDIFNLKLRTLGIKYNSFCSIHYDFADLLKNLTILELDWLKYSFKAIISVIVTQSRWWMKSFILSTFHVWKRESNNYLITVKPKKKMLPLKYSCMLFLNDHFLSTNSIKSKSLFIKSRGQSMLFKFIYNESLGLIKFYCQEIPTIIYKCDNDGL